jgi:hypothetical protein
MAKALDHQFRLGSVNSQGLVPAGGIEPTA